MRSDRQSRRKLTAVGRTMTQPQSASQEVLAGLVERVTYHNAENGFCVLRAKARGHRDIVTVVGHAATIAAGEWVNDRTHGQQFKARFLRTSPPKTRKPPSGASSSLSKHASPSGSASMPS